MTGQEGYLEVPGGRVWYRWVGESTGDRAPLLCLHGFLQLAGEITFIGASLQQLVEMLELRHTERAWRSHLARL